MAGKKLKTMGPIGIRHEMSIQNMWRLNRWIQALADQGQGLEPDDLQVFADQMQLGCDELCASGTDAASAAGFAQTWPGGPK